MLVSSMGKAASPCGPIVAGEKSLSGSFWTKSPSRVYSTMAWSDWDMSIKFPELGS